MKDPQDAAPTTFVALTPRSVRPVRSPAPGHSTPPLPGAVPPSPHRLPSAGSVDAPRLQPPTPSSGAGGFSGYQVNHATTQHRIQKTRSQPWALLGVGLGLVLLAVGAAALSIFGT